MSDHTFLFVMGRNGIPEERLKKAFVGPPTDGQVHRGNVQQDNSGVLIMRPWSETWCMVKEGCGTAIEFKHLSSEEDVSIDGHRLANNSTCGNLFDGARRSYFLHTWSGAKVQYDPSVVEVVRTNHISSMYPTLLNADAVNKVLIVDNTPSTGITPANYCYSLPTKIYVSDKTNSCRSRRWLTTTTYIDLNAAGNLGVVNVYPMTHGTTPPPPHHPMDFIPELKQGMYVGNEFGDLVTFTKDFMTDLEGHVVCFLDYTNYTPDRVMKIMIEGGFNSCFPISDLMAAKMDRGGCVIKPPRQPPEFPAGCTYRPMICRK